MSLILFSKKSKHGKFKLYFWLHMPKLGQTGNNASLLKIPMRK
jgi:hypothetical protein